MDMKADTLGIIPARLQSSRFPKKLIQKINGFPLVYHTYRRVVESGAFGEVIVAADDPEIGDVLAPYSVPVLLTDPSHPSGTFRVIEVMEKKPEYPFFVNIQGDEPLIPPETIHAVVKTLHEYGNGVATAAMKITEEAAYLDPNTVKVVFNEAGKALYFSRSPIPHDRDKKELFRSIFPYKHIGIYGYSREALRTIKNLKESILENLEKLEQLRFLDGGMDIRVAITTKDSIGVDTREDFEKVKNILEN